MILELGHHLGGQGLDPPQPLSRHRPHTYTTVQLSWEGLHVGDNRIHATIQEVGLRSRSQTLLDVYIEDLGTR